MRAVITVRHPDLAPEERAYRMEELKKRTIEYMKEVKFSKKEGKADATA